MPRASFYFEEFIIFARFCYPPLYSVLSSLELFNFLPLLWVFVSLKVSLALLPWLFLSPTLLGPEVLPPASRLF